MLSLHCRPSSAVIELAGAREIWPISVGQISLQDRVAEMMVEAHKISRLEIT